VEYQLNFSIFPIHYYTNNKIALLIYINC